MMFMTDRQMKVLFFFSALSFIFVNFWELNRHQLLGGKEISSESAFSFFLLFFEGIGDSEQVDGFSQFKDLICYTQPDSYSIPSRLTIHIEVVLIWLTIFFLPGSWWRLSFQKLKNKKKYSGLKEKRSFIRFLSVIVNIIWFFQGILLPLSVFGSKVILLLPLLVGHCYVKLIHPFVFF